MPGSLVVRVRQPRNAGEWHATTLAGMSEATRRKYLKSLSDEEALHLFYDWRFWARPNQVAPGGNWTNWLMLAGRGFGKTRAGAEWVREQVEVNGKRAIAMVAPTARDTRRIMVEGPSGLLNLCPPWAMPTYHSSKGEIAWPNGAKAFLYSAEEPERLRGPEHDAAWCDELAAWQYREDTWDMLQFTLRAGDNPQVVKMAAVRNFRNRGYSYESELYVSPCAGHGGRFSYLKCWHGVPLRAEVMPPEQSEIQPRQKLMMHRLPDLVIDHGLCDGRDPQDSQVARLLSRLGR